MTYYEMLEWLDERATLKYGDARGNWNCSENMTALFFHIPKDRDSVFEWLKLNFKKSDSDELVLYEVITRLLAKDKSE